MGMSQTRAGACWHFGLSEPHSGTLWRGIHHQSSCVWMIVLFFSLLFNEKLSSNHEIITLIQWFRIHVWSNISTWGPTMKMLTQHSVGKSKVVCIVSSSQLSSWAGQVVTIWSQRRGFRFLLIWTFNHLVLGLFNNTTWYYEMAINMGLDWELSIDNIYT